jgi:hypothetical protein
VDDSRHPFCTDSNSIEEVATDVVVFDVIAGRILDENTIQLARPGGTVIEVGSNSVIVNDVALLGVVLRGVALGREARDQDDVRAARNGIAQRRQRVADVVVRVLDPDAGIFVVEDEVVLDAIAGAEVTVAGCVLDQDAVVQVSLDQVASDRVVVRNLGVCGEVRAGKSPAARPRELRT